MTRQSRRLAGLLLRPTSATAMFGKITESASNTFPSRARECRAARFFTKGSIEALILAGERRGGKGSRQPPVRVTAEKV